MRRTLRAVALAALLATAGPLAAQGGDGASLQAFLMTMGPGASVYERFGHNALWIRDTTTGLDLVYNYGTFDFDEPGFVGRFVFGRPRYWLAVSTLDATLRSYEFFRRDVMVQELALAPGKRAELALRLAENAQPEQRTYTYDYYRDNCSTRVRDMLDLVLDGALRRATAGVPGAMTLREHTQRSVSNDPAMYLGILAAMGPAVDEPLDQWDEMFLPAKVQERVRELTVRTESGAEVPLVLREDTLLAIGAFSVEPTRPDWSGRLLLVALVLGGVVASGMARGAAGVPGRILASLVLVGAGVGGLVLLFLWLATDHVATRWNWSVALLNPLGLLLLPMLWHRTGPGVLGRAGGVLVTVVATGLAIGSLAMLLGAQESREVAALALVPLTASLLLATTATRRPERAPPSPR